MRIMVIVLSSFAALVIIAHAAVPLRLTSLTGNGVRTPEVLSCLALFAAWAVATALVYPAPTLASWCFALASVIGLYAGISLGFRVLIVWGVIAGGLAVLTTLARREKRLADQRDWQREQQEIAVYLAMRGIQETVPELLAHGPTGELPRAAPGVPAQPTTAPNVPVRTRRREPALVGNGGIASGWEPPGHYVSGEPGRAHHVHRGAG